MKKSLIMLLVIVMAAGCLTGCGKKDTGGAGKAEEASVNQEGAEEDSGENYRVALLVTGTLGDKSWWDACAKGIENVGEKYDNVETKIVEAGSEETAWEPALVDLSEQGYDLIFTCAAQVQEILPAVAEQYPDQNYALLDASCEQLPNIYCAEIRQNEGSFLAGALAAMMTESGIEGTNDENLIGVVGAMDIPVINDFIVGYIAGAQYVNADVKVAVSYAGSFSDPTKGKELALAQIQAGSDIEFQVAAGTGIGILQAAAEQGVYSIGVDSDQAEGLRESSPESAERIITSVYKSVDMMIENVVAKVLDGTMEYGIYEKAGIAEDAMGIVYNDNYEKLVPEEIRDKVEEIRKGISDGTIEVPSAFSMEHDEVMELIDSVRP